MHLIRWCRPFRAEPLRHPFPVLGVLRRRAVTDCGMPYDRDSEEKRKKRAAKKKGAKRPHPKASKFSDGPATAEQIARGQGTAGNLGALPPEAYTRPMQRPSSTFSNCFFASGVGGSATILAGVVQGRIHASGGGVIVLDKNVVVDEGTTLTADVGSRIEAKNALMGDRFVDDMELSSELVNQVTSTQISSPTRTVFSAVGHVPKTEADHLHTGDAIAKHLGDRHEVVPEKSGGAGAVLRDGTTDEQVDVFLKAFSGKKEDDRKLQVVQMPAAANDLGTHGAVVDLVVDDQSIQRAIAHKNDFADKDEIDLVVSCPLPIGSASMRRRLDAATTERRFDKHGYARVWFVDATGWVTLLGE